MKDSLGISGQKFELLLERTSFIKGDILKFEIEGSLLEVLSTPKPHYTKWYWRVLNFLTFRLFFNIKYTHTVKIV